MAIDTNALLTRCFSRPVAWTRSDTATYMLGISADHGADAVMPTFAAALARNTAPHVGELGGNYARSVLAGTHLTMHQGLRSEGKGIAESRIKGVEDRGDGRGALILIETQLRGAQGTAIATATAAILAREDGGCGSAGDRLAAKPVPERAPDAVILLPIRADQAALYSRSGDTNPLHLDPVAARARGFPQPILHGLCTYAFAARAVVSAFCAGDPAGLIAHEARFTAPVMPGETLRLVLWRNGDLITFEAFEHNRGVKVLASGYSRVAT